MGDDIGWMQPSCYHRGLMVGETPNIDRIANEGGIFMTAYAESSCTAGRTAFFTGMTPMRAGMLMPQLPGAISYLRPGTPTLARFLYNLGYTTGQFGKNHLGDNPDSLPTAHGFQEFWGYLYHLDAMEQVSFPDINKQPRPSRALSRRAKRFRFPESRTPRAKLTRRPAIALRRRARSSG